MEYGGTKCVFRYTCDMEHVNGDTYHGSMVKVVDM